MKIASGKFAVLGYRKSYSALRAGPLVYREEFLCPYGYTYGYKFCHRPVLIYRNKECVLFHVKTYLA